MADKSEKTKARLPRGFADRSAEDIRAVEKMMATIRSVYELYGFEPADQPLIEYTDALGKFLPDQDRPNEGVFSFQDDDDQWLSLRYDLTAPTARFVAENYERLPKPYRSYRSGWVFRNEKPGPGRFRQFMQFDADTIGTPGVAADAEMAMMMADVMEALGIKRGDYVIRVNNRKVLDGVLEAIDLGGDQNAGRRLTVLRAIDKLDKLGVEGVQLLLGAGRKDESGDFTKGAGLPDIDRDKVVEAIQAVALNKNKKFRSIIKNAMSLTDHQIDEITTSVADLIGKHLAEIAYDVEKISERVQLDKEKIDKIIEFAAIGNPEILKMGSVDSGEEFESSLDKNFYTNYDFAISKMWDLVGDSETGRQGVSELEEIGKLLAHAGYRDRVDISWETVRGLEYYTGPVFEAELLAEIPNEDGQIVRFGSVGGGGRYDGLVSRFRGEPVPATGFSIGVSRLMTALKNLGKLDSSDVIAPVVVLVMDKDTDSLGRYQKMVAELRAAGIRSEMYLGGAGMKAQLKYADRRGCPVAVIQGGDERAKGELQIKDLIEGARMSAEITGNAEWRAARPAQVTVAESELVAEVKKILAAQAADRAK